MADKINDGGPAFPMLWNAAHNSEWQVEDGMSLRDWFAGQALASGAVDGSMSETELARLFPGTRSVSKQEVMAVRAYLIADAMLAARQHGEQK